MGCTADCNYGQGTQITVAVFSGGIVHKRAILATGLLPYSLEKVIYWYFQGK